MGRSLLRFSGFLVLTFCLGPSLQQVTAQTTNVTTGHQDIPAICAGCVYRTGQNLHENTGAPGSRPVVALSSQDSLGSGR